MKTELKWAVIFAVMGLVWLMLEYLVGLQTKHIAWHPLLTNLVFLPTIAVYVLALCEKRAQLGGKLTFKQGLISGLSLAAFAALLSPLGQPLFHQFVNPNFFADMVQFTVSSGKATLAEALSFFNLPSYLLMSGVGALMTGLLASLILAWLLRTKQAEKGAAS